MTYMQAALAILAHTDRPLTIGEMTSIAVAQELVRPRGRTPDRSMSSILYRRMASDPDAPISCIAGRFWLRGRPLAATLTPALRPGVRHVHRILDAHEAHARRATRSDVSGDIPARRVTVLPPPPLTIALPETTLVAPALLSSAIDGSGRRTRAVARLENRLRDLAARVRPLQEDAGSAWDAGRVQTGLIAPLLSVLGYRRVDRQVLQPVHGRNALLLHVAGAPVLVLDICHAGHALGDGDARPTLSRAVTAGVSWAALTNGHELRLYARDLAGALSDPSAALVLRVDLYTWPDGAARTDAAHMLWLLSRQAVAAGVLDAYLASRAVGSTLLGALEDPNSELVQVLARAVAGHTGLHLPASLLARHARLAVRGRRDRDGAPLPDEIPVVAAVLGVPRSAMSGIADENERAS